MNEEFELEAVEAVAPVQLEYAVPLSMRQVAMLLYTQSEVRAALRGVQDDMMRLALLADFIEDWTDEFQSTNPAEYFEPETNPLLLIDTNDTAWEEVAMFMFVLETEAQILLSRMMPNVA